MSDQIDSSNNIIPGEIFSENFIRLLTQVVPPGDTFTIESTYISPNLSTVNEVPNADDSQPQPSDDETDEEMPELEDSESPPVPIQDLYSEMTRLFSLPIDGSNNEINNMATVRRGPRSLFTGSAIFNNEGLRRHRRRRGPVFGGMAGPSVNDVNTDYENFIGSLFVNRLIPQQNITQLLQSSLLDPSQNVYKNVISEKGEDSIKKCKYNTADFSEQKSCPITLMDFTEDEEVAQLPCGHIFKYEAIMKWLKNEDSRCPVCRESLDSKEIKKDKKIVAPTPPGARQNQRITSRNLISHMLNTRIRREEEQELQAAIMASIRDMENT